MMHSQRTRLFTALLALALVPMLACSQLDTKRKQGAAVGAGVGAAAGALFGSGWGKVAAIGAGAILGGVVGYQVGRYLEEDDQEQLAEATKTTIRTGREQTWENPDTGVRGRTRVVDERRVEEPLDLQMAEDVRRLAPLELVGETYVANVTSNLRAGPGTDYAVLDVIPEDSQIPVLGKVQGRNWYLVGVSGKAAARGYVQANLLDPLPAGQSASPAKQFEPDRPVGDLVTETTEVERMCRTVEQTVYLNDGRTEKDEVRACKTLQGWQTGQQEARG